MIIVVAAVPADEDRSPDIEQLACPPVGAGRGSLNGDDVQQPPHQRQAGLAGEIGQQAAVPDAMEAAREHLLQEAAHERLRRQCHGLVACLALGVGFDAVVLPFEGDAALVQGEQPAVGDGHPVRVARQTGHLFCLTAVIDVCRHQSAARADAGIGQVALRNRSSDFNEISYLGRDLHRGSQCKTHANSASRVPDDSAVFRWFVSLAVQLFNANAGSWSQNSGGGCICSAMPVPFGPVAAASVGRKR